MSIAILFTNGRPITTQNGVERVTGVLAKHFREKGFQVYFMHLRKYRHTELYSDPVYFFPEEDPGSKSNMEFYHAFLKDKNIRIIINQSAEWIGESSAFLNTGDQPVIKLSCYHSRPLRNIDTINSFFPKQKLTIAKIIKMILYPYFRRRESKKIKKLFIFLQQNNRFVVLLSLKFIPQLMHWPEIDPYKFTALPNPNTFSGIPFIPSVAKRKQLLYVGRLMYEAKNIFALISIWKKLYKQFLDWELILCGDGPQEALVKAEVQSLPNVRVTGFKDPRPYYQTASIFCFTSTYEGWGLGLTESMQYSMIPVAFNSFESITDIIEDGVSGFIIRPYSISKYVKCLTYLMNLPDEDRDVIAMNAYQSVKKYDVENVMLQWTDFIHQLINEDETHSTDI